MKTTQNPDQEITNGEESSDEEDGHAVGTVTFKSKSRYLSWSSSPSCFELFLTEFIETMVENMTNLEGKQIFSKTIGHLLQEREVEETKGRGAVCVPRHVKTSIMCHKRNAYICKAHATT